MKKRVAIRKLNRTLLKKEGTKEVYLTGKNVLMPFFDFEKIEDLPTSRKDDLAKRLFSYKRLINKDQVLTVAKENNEVRLTGFEDYFSKNNIKEVDQILIECYETDGTKRYTLDYIICRNTRVLQKYDTKDSSDNYSIGQSNKGIIQFSELATPNDTFENGYWLWDDSFDEVLWEQLLAQPIDCVFLNKGKVNNKKIKITKTSSSFEKLLKALSNSNNKLETQNKAIYEIEELINDKWKTANFDGVKNLELVYENGRLKISNRDSMTFCLYEGGNV